MSRAVVLVWLGAVAAHGEHEPDLAGWAASRMVALDEPGPAQGLTAAGHDDALATRIEGLLAEARTAAYAADSGTAETALESAELLLRGNPSLPEAGWLMAETCRDHAALVRARDPALATILEQRATALDGGRATAFSDSRVTPETGPKTASPATVPATTVAATPSVALDGPLSSDEVDLDGVAMPTVADRRSLGEGEHHVRVLRAGQLAWAGWVTADGPRVRIPVPGVAPCSETDLARASASGDRVETGGAVLCPEWAVARDAGSERIEVARCHGASCGTFLPWSRSWGRDLEGPMHPPWPEHPSRTWIAWTAASVAALGVGAVVLWQAGAFDRQGPPQESYRFTAVPAPR